jgi:hypothetical protein
MSDELQYPGCRPGWHPDEYAAEREQNPWPIEDQIAAEQAHWKLEQEEAGSASSVDSTGTQEEHHDDA